MEPIHPTPTSLAATSPDEASPAAFGLADALPHPVWVLEGDQVFFNRSFTEFTGLPTPGPSHLDETLTRVVHPDDREPWEAIWAKARSERKAQALELRLRRHDGAYLWFTAHLGPLAQNGWVVSYTEVDGLRQAQAETVAMRERMGEAYFTLDREWRFTYLNREAERLLGQPREQLLGKGLWEEYAEAVGTEFHRQYTRAMQEGIPVAFEAYYPPLETWFEVHAHPEASGLAVHFRAINDRKQAEAALQESELKHRRLFETVPLGVVYQDQEGRILSANPAAQEILGLTLDQMRGLTSMDPRWRAVREDGSELPGSEHPAMVALNTGKPVRGALMGVFNPQRGELRWISVDATPLFEGGAQRPTRVYTVFRDVTEQRRAEEALQKQLELTATITNNSTQALFMMDARGYCTFMNSAAEQMLGFTLEEIRAKPLHEMIHHHHPDGRPYPMSECPIDRALPENFDIREHEDVFIRKNGEFFPVLVAASPIFDDDGRPISTVIEVRDVTEQRKAQQALKESENRLRLILESIGEGVYGIDAQGRCTFINPAAARMLGYEPEEVLGKDMHALVHHHRPDGAPYPLEECPIYHAMEGHQGCRVESEVFWRKDGTALAVEYSAHPILERGEVQGAVISFVDITERKQAENALRESEARFRAISEHAPIGIYLSDPSGHNLYTNVQAQKIGGYTLEQGLGRGWTEFIHPQDRERVIAECTAATQAAKPYEIRYRWLRPDGTVRSSRVIGVPLSDEQGRLVGYAGTVEDTTEREWAEEALRQSEERYRSLVEATAQIVWDTPAHGEFVREQPGWAAFTGQRFEEYQGWGWLEAVHPEDQEHTARVWSEAVREHKPYQVEHRLRRHDGEYRHMRVRAVPVRNPDGSVREWVGLHTDISEEKQAEQATAYLAAIVEPSVDAVISKDLGGVITSWNRGAEEMYGYSAQEVVGQPVALLIPPHLLEEEEKILEQVRRGERVEQYETLRRHKDGAEIHVSLTVSPIWDRGGRVIGVSSIARNITEQKLEEEGLRFLDQASVALASSLEVEETLRQVARLAVPRLADWCSVSLPNAEGQLEALEIAHTDPERVRLVRELAADYPEDPEAPGSSAQLMRSGQYSLVSEVTDEMLQAVARDERHLELMRKLELGSALVVPMLVGGKAVGLIGLGMNRGKRRFGERDLALAQELGRRAAVALEHARLYRQLQEREQELRTLAETIPQLAWMADESGYIFWYNQRWYDYTGTAPAEMEGWGWQKVHDPEMLPKVMERWQESIRTGQPFEMVFPLRGRDGRFRQFLTRVVPLRDEKGRVVRWFGTNTDITQQIETEEALRESEERYRSLIENYPGGAVILFDQDLRYLLVDGLGLGDVGLSPEEMEERTVYELFEPELAERLAGLYRRALAGERVNDEVNFGERIYLLRVTPVRSLDGRVRQGLAFTQDITELKRLERELRTLNAELEARVAERTAELERSNRDLEQFAYVASHDLQEPLRMISSYTQLLAKRYAGKLDEKADQYIHYAVDGANRMQRLIQDLLAYSRVGTRAQALEPTDANTVLQETLENLQFAIQENGAVVEADPLPRVLADRSQLGQVFQNLIANALKFRHPERPLHIRVGAVRQDGMWRFSVQDNGIGIEEQYFERIFVIFQRLHGKEDYPGSGIGLALCKKIVERHGGKIWLESEVGEGSCFYFTWPAANGNPKPKERPVNEEQR
ncbi:MAG TPA: PAS domain S-box protein [Meiothermus sp.]|nr:PAS domain S-box protein [Meiothermus sp.]